jgi:predicted RNase H-like HicB family nuclease
MDDDLQQAVPFTEDELAVARRYAVVIQWSPEDKVYIAEVPQLRGAKTHGTTPAEAADMAAEVAALWLRMAIRTGASVPDPRPLQVTA